MMLKLSDEEKRMLDGADGLLKQKALEMIVRYAGVVGAEHLCRVTKAHLFCGAHHYLSACRSGDVDEVISEMCLCSEEKIILSETACYCQSDVGPMDPDNWQKMGVTEGEYQKNRIYLGRYLAAGVNLVGSCIPYLVGFVPLKGEHYVTSESHAVLVFNSLWGACGHADGIEAGFCSAVCGRTPLWGLHLPGNRHGSHTFHVQYLAETVKDWDLLGYTVGRLIPSRSIPVLKGEFGRPDIIRLKSCFAAMATTSGAEICHIPGVTLESVPEDQTFSNQQPMPEILITRKDIGNSLEMLNYGGGGAIDFISLGCPHYSIEELRQVAAFLHGQQISANLQLQVWTSAPIKATSDRCGYTHAIERAGGLVLTSSCPLTSEKMPAGISAVAFDSAKQAHYIKPSTSAKVYYGSMADCLKAAISGYWEGD